MLAIYNLKKTGKGKRIDVAMLDTMFAALEDSIMTYSLMGKPLHRSGNAKPNEIVPMILICAGMINLLRLL